jgi:membrane protease YdiL (CAAX protease family)
MSKFTEGARALAVATLGAVAITAIGQGLWGVMAIANVAYSPAIPWAPAVMPLILIALALFLAGRIGPQRSAGARRSYVPLAPVSTRAWGWSLLAGFTGIVALAALWTVLGQLVRVPPNLLPPIHGVPLTTLVPMLLVGIVAAPVTEEIAFRGYAMGILTRHFGPIAAIAISSVLFMAVHLTQGPYPTKLLVYLLVGLALAVTVWRTGSLLPALVVHSFGDLVFFTCVWPHDGTRRLMTEGGADASFYAALAALAVASVVSLAGFRQLLRVTGERRPIRRQAAVAVAVAD